MSEEKKAKAPKKRKPRAKKKEPEMVVEADVLVKEPEMSVKGDMLVKGDKANTIEALTNDKGFFPDQFGNKIYPTESKENQARLKELGLK